MEIPSSEPIRRERREIKSAVRGFRLLWCSYYQPRILRRINRECPGIYSRIIKIEKLNKPSMPTRKFLHKILEEDPSSKLEDYFGVSFLLIQLPSFIKYNFLETG